MPGQAIGAFGPDPHDQAPVPHHRRPVQVDEFLDGRVMRVPGHRRQLGVPVDDGVGPEVVARDMKADPRVTAQVTRLGPVIGDRNPDDLRLRIPPVVHVGQLRPPVLPEGHEHPLPPPRNKLSKPVLDHAPQNNSRASDVPPGPLVGQAGQRRRTGIEPADDAARRPPVLKTGGATRHPDTSATTLLAGLASSIARRPASPRRDPDDRRSRLAGQPIRCAVRSARQGNNVGGSGHLWWEDAVVYQVYPRSFADADGNGVGDLPGLRSRLGYLADLGVDAVWLTPFYPSPMADGGYDVSDYRAVDPLFGTMADFDALVKDGETHQIRVVVGLVPNDF